MKKLINLIVIVSFFGVISCQKTVNSAFPNNPELPSLLSYFDITSKHTNAAFGVSLSTSMRDKNNEYAPLSFQGLFLSNNGSAVKGGLVKFNNQSFTTSDGYYGSGSSLDKNLVGEKRPFSFQKPSTFDIQPNSLTSGNLELGSTIYDTLYVPKLLDIKSGQPTADDMSQNVIKLGHQFTWIPDPKNISMGVIIGVEYYPSDILNSAYKTVQPRPIKHGRVIEDNGSYKLDSFFFTDIPVGAAVQITIARANYKLDTDTESTPYTLFAYNFKFADYYYRGN